jgi:Sigma-54 interaction domain
MAGLKSFDSSVSPLRRNSAIRGRANAGLFKKRFFRKWNKLIYTLSPVRQDKRKQEGTGTKEDPFRWVVTEEAPRSWLAKLAWRILPRCALTTTAAVALLRVLQEREFERVGGSRRIRADVRVIAATTRDLQAAVRAGSFRSDLFYWLNVFPIENPLGATEEQTFSCWSSTSSIASRARRARP